MSLTEKTQRQLIRNRINDITDMAQDINLEGAHVAAVNYRVDSVGSVEGFSHSLRVAVGSPRRGRKTLEVDLPTPEWTTSQLDACLTETEYVRQQLRELLQEGQPS
ncbi:hypothetical protein QC589_01640 [Halomonas elongata]|uniref:hypothetical protein n=1 Tax=Halomonas elongata TaxID=2746 RepID=UPI00335E85AA